MMTSNKYYATLGRHAGLRNRGHLPDDDQNWFFADPAENGTDINHNDSHFPIS